MSRSELFDLYGAVVGEILEMGALLPQELAQVPLPEWFLEMMVVRRTVYPEQAKKYITRFGIRGLVKFRSAVPRMFDYPDWVQEVFGAPVNVVYLVPTSQVPPITILGRVEEFMKQTHIALRRLGENVHEEPIIPWDVVKVLNVEVLVESPLSEALFRNSKREQAWPVIAREFYYQALKRSRWFIRFLEEQEAILVESRGIRPVLSPGEAVEKVDAYLTNLLTNLVGGDSE